MSSTMHGSGDAEAIAALARSWAAMTSIRPPVADLARYEQALVESALPPGSEVLLLGATPELRSMILAHGHRLTGCDIDEPFWRAMTSLRTVGGDETFIHGDWLALPEEHRHALVLGDGSLNMLTWPGIQAMVAKLPGLLRAGGRVVLRIQAVNPALDLDTLREAIAAYSHARTTMAFVASIHCLVESLRNAMSPELGRREFYESVVSRYLDAQELEALRPMLRDKRNCYPPMPALEGLLRERFASVHHEPCPGPDTWGTMHLFVATLAQ